MNTPSTVDSVGVSFGSVTADENHNRSSVHERLLEVHDNGSDRLSFSFDTLATKVLLCTPHRGAQPRAYGVEIAPGAALAVASNFHGKSQLKTKKITVRHEVIISAGVFQSPQLVSKPYYINLKASPLRTNADAFLCSSWYVLLVFV